MTTFEIKPKINYGKNALDSLDKLNMHSVCIATDPTMIKLGFVDKIITFLEKRNIDYRIFDSIQPDPTQDTVETGLRHIIESKPDTLIAIGGGSVVDSAKAIMYACLKLKEKFIEKEMLIKPYFVAIPTTAGTGSEVTGYSVITDKDTQVKTPLFNEWMLPDLAILDPELTLSIPKHITAETAMDALTHAVEAYLSNKANPFSDAYAIQAIDLIYKNIVAAFKDGQNTEAREALQIASTMAGIAFNNAALGVNHALAHAIGSVYHMSHGKANAIMLPRTLAFAIQDERLETRLSDLAIRLNLDFGDPKINAMAFVESIKMINTNLEIPFSLTASGINGNDLMNKVDSMAESASKDYCIQGNLVTPTIEDLRGMIIDAI